MATVIIGFNEEGDLMLEYEIVNYDHPLESHIKNVVVDKQEAYILAKEVNISLTQLPAYIAKKYGVQPFCQSAPSEAIALFKEILGHFASSGVKYEYRIKYKQ